MTSQRRRRPAVVIVGSVVLALLVGLLLWRVVARHNLAVAQEAFKATAEKVGADLGHPPALARADNAVPWLRAAAALVDYGVVGGGLEPVAGRSPASWSADERAAVGRLLDDHGEAIRLLHRAAAAGGADWALGFSLEAPIPPLGGLLACARLLSVSAALHLEAGEQGAALEDLRALATIARSLEREKQMICPLVGAEAENTLLATVRSGIAAGRIGRREAAVLLEVLPHGDLTAALRNALGVETEVRASYLSSHPPIGIGAWAGIPWRETVLAELYRLGALRLEEAGEPFASLAQHRLASLEVRFPLRLVMPQPFGSLLGVARRMQETTALRRLAVTGLDLIRDAARTGAYPATLPAGGEAPEPYCNCKLRLEARADGGAVLSLPGADELDKKRGGWAVRHEPARFSWELPDPSRLP